MIPGFWNVSEQFQEQAKIDQMILYFSEGNGYMYDGYFIMVVDGETLFNGTMIFRITPKGYFRSDNFVFETEKDTSVMPKKMTMVLCPITGLMELKCLSDKKVYARLFKDNQLSAKTVLKISGHDASITVNDDEAISADTAIDGDAEKT
jgi:hypothetical protein